MEHEIHADLPGINQLLDCYGAILAVSISVVGLYDGRSVPSREEEIVSVTAGLPFLGSYNLLSLILNIIDGGLLDLSIFVPEGMEDRDISQSEAVGELVIVTETIRFNFEGELGLSDGGIFISHGGVNDVVVIVDTVLIFTLVFVITFIGKSSNHVDIGSHFPQI